MKCYLCGSKDYVCEVETDKGYIDLCRTCLDEYYAPCNDCNRMVHNDDVLYTNSSYDDYICHNCYERSYFICASCGEIWHNDDLIENRNGEYLCEGCHDDNPSDEYFTDETFGTIEFVTETKKYRHKPDSLFFGLELEVERDGSEIPRYEMVNQIKDILSRNNTHDFMEYKEDGSLDCGIEFVTLPFTWEWYKNNKHIFDNILETLKSCGYRSYDPGTCGIHIHMSRDMFTTLHLYKMLKLFYERGNEGFILNISQRKRHSRVFSCSWGGNNNYEDIDSIKDRAKCKRPCGERYTALNLTNSDTIECRIFRGTLNKQSFHKNIEFMQCVYDFTSENSVKNINKDKLIDYIFDHKHEYKNLYSFVLNLFWRYI